MTELLEQLKTGLPDEIKGVKSYIHMAHEAKAAGNDCEAAMLKQMAWEEHTHAKHIMHILDKHGVSYAELAPAFSEAEQMLYNA